jgi:streptogramin lyase
MQPISAATGIIAAMAMAPLAPTSSDAAIITQTYNVEAAGFAHTVASVGAGWSTHDGTATVGTAVPQPSALALLPLGLLAIGAFARRPRAQ